MPSACLLARTTITAAFQRMKARMRRSMSSSPGKKGSSSGGMVLTYGRGHRGRGADLQLAGPLQELRHQEPGAGLAVRAHHRVERVEPLLGLARIRVRELVDESVDDHDPHHLASTRQMRHDPPVTSSRLVTRPSPTPTAPAPGTPVRAGGPGPIPGGRFASGAEAHTTNQRMEITAAFEAVQAHRGPARGRERLDLRRPLLPRPVARGLGEARAGRTRAASRSPTVTCGSPSSTSCWRAATSPSAG